ncbi:MAG TPA: hypothetical protein VFF43_16050, partial [Caldimonas sp.]|nr:hypothetical protein [Caldimonas sp.]
MPSCVWQTASPARAFASQLASSELVVVAPPNAEEAAFGDVVLADDVGRFGASATAVGRLAPAAEEAADRAGAEAVTAATRGGVVAADGSGSDIGFTSTGEGGDGHVGAALAACAATFAGPGGLTDATVVGLGGGAAFGLAAGVADAIASGADATIAGAVATIAGGDDATTTGAAATTEAAVASAAEAEDAATAAARSGSVRSMRLAASDAAGDARGATASSPRPALPCGPS